MSNVIQIPEIFGAIVKNLNYQDFVKYLTINKFDQNQLNQIWYMKANHDFGVTGLPKFFDNYRQYYHHLNKYNGVSAHLILTNSLVDVNINAIDYLVERDSILKITKSGSLLIYYTDGDMIAEFFDPPPNFSPYFKVTVRDIDEGNDDLTIGLENTADSQIKIVHIDPLVSEYKFVKLHVRNGVIFGFLSNGDIAILETMEPDSLSKISYGKIIYSSYEKSDKKSSIFVLDVVRFENKKYHIFDHVIVLDNGNAISFSKSTYLEEIDNHLNDIFAPVYILGGEYNLYEFSRSGLSMYSEDDPTTIYYLYGDNASRTIKLPQKFNIKKFYVRPDTGQLLIEDYNNMVTSVKNDMVTQVKGTLVYLPLWGQYGLSIDQKDISQGKVDFYVNGVKKHGTVFELYNRDLGGNTFPAVFSGSYDQLTTSILLSYNYNKRYVCEMTIDNNTKRIVLIVNHM